MRNGDVSFWWRALGGDPPRRPSLPGPAEADVCIVGAGYTGLWTAYYLKRAQPSLRVVVLEAVFAGFGASGRNGGWLSNLMPGSRERYARGPRGRAGVVDFQRQLNERVDEVAAVCAAEGIDAGLVKGGNLAVATSPAQLERLRQRLAHDRAWDAGPEDARWLSASEVRDRINVADAQAAIFNPHCARIQPARLAAGLARAAERAGVEIYEATPVTGITSGRARTPFGDVRAPAVLRATEGFTSRLPGLRRTWLPMNSSLIVTEPLGKDAWAEIGWTGEETLGDAAHVYMYAQRTADGRIALGGRGVPYRYGSGLDHRGATQAATVRTLTRILHRMFPATRDVAIDHAWCGVLGVPRDWCATVSYDRAAGLGWAGGYVGHGVTAASLAGQTLADLVLGEETERTALPWAGHKVRNWEPEPLRWTGVRSLYALYRLADGIEDRRRDGRTAAIARIGDLISGKP